MSKIFMIGATGHIGGAVLNIVYPKYGSTHTIKALVRDAAKGERLVARYPNLKVVIGDMSNLDILENESREADIVIHAGPDSGESSAISAMLKGLQNRTLKPYYIHTSGAALIMDVPDGTHTGRVWDDVADIQEMKSLPRSYVHATEDHLVWDASSTVHTAIISPSIIYGLSPSTDHPVSIVTPWFDNLLKKYSGGFTISKGANMLSYVHVLDLAPMYLALLTSALNSEGDTSSTPQKWGNEAYYFAGNEDLPFHTVMTSLVSQLQGTQYISSNKITEIPPQKIPRGSLPSELDNLAEALFGCNTRVTSTRAKTLLGWEAKQPSLLEGMKEPLDVLYERQKQR